MKTLYAISTGGCRDGIYLDFIIDSLEPSKVEALALKYFEEEIKSYNKYTFINYFLNIKDSEITITYMNEVLEEIESKVLDFFDIGKLL